MMNRRDMLRTAAVGMAAVGLRGADPALAALGGDGAERRRRSGRPYPIVSGLDVSILDEEYVRRLRMGGVDMWHKSISGINGQLSMGQVYEFADEHPGTVTVTTTVRQMRDAYDDGVIAIVFGSQTADRFNPRWLRNELRAEYEAGLRILGITYNLPNIYGSGNFLPYLPLTAEGRKLVEELHRLGILLDVGGHNGEQTSLDAIAMAPEIPVVVTHANVAGIVDNPRNVSDRLIEAVASTGGVVGLTAVNDFHTRRRGQLDLAHAPRAYVKDHVDQMEYLRRLVGVDYIGLGPDFVYGREVDYDAMNRTHAINRMIISDGPLLYVDGFEDISELPNVVTEMERRGWSQQDIAKVMGGNWLRVYEKAWGG
jgi:membrane dipeptidase